MAKPPRNPFKPHGRNFPGAQLPPKPQPKKDVSGVAGAGKTVPETRNNTEN
jgi:hypothetical protein